MFKRTILAIAVAGLLAGCSATDTPQQKADTITMAYLPFRAAASMCAAGLPSKPCGDPNVSENVKKALPLADAAVAEATKQIAADPERSNVAKWSSYAMSAIGVLAQALATYGVKPATDSR
jgi:hypothetical protein